MNTKILIGVAIALAMAGCASTPKPNEALESARSIVQAAEADPERGQVCGSGFADGQVRSGSR